MPDGRPEIPQKPIIIKEKSFPMTKSKIDLALKILIGGLLAALIVIIAGSLNERVVKAGDTAPDFSITTDQGRKVTSTNFGGKGLALHFWASWGTPCREDAPPPT